MDPLLQKIRIFRYGLPCTSLGAYTAQALFERTIYFLCYSVRSILVAYFRLLQYPTTTWSSTQPDPELSLPVSAQELASLLYGHKGNTARSNVFRPRWSNCVTLNAVFYVICPDLSFLSPPSRIPSSSVKYIMVIITLQATHSPW